MRWGGGEGGGHSFYTARESNSEEALVMTVRDILCVAVFFYESIRVVPLHALYTGYLQGLSGVGERRGGARRFPRL